VLNVFSSNIFKHLILSFVQYQLQLVNFSLLHGVNKGIDLVFLERFRQCEQLVRRSHCIVIVTISLTRDLDVDEGLLSSIFHIALFNQNKHVFLFKSDFALTLTW